MFYINREDVNSELSDEIKNLRRKHHREKIEKLVLEVIYKRKELISMFCFILKHKKIKSLCF